MRSITIQAVENGFIVAPWYKPTCGEHPSQPCYVYNSLADLQKQLPALLGAEVAAEPQEQS